MIRQIQYFNKVFVPKFIEAKIQECAIEHLGVRDIGKLRDKFEGQRYYDSLRLDIISEFVFEKFLDLGDFEWDKRRIKNYQRNSYEFGIHQIKVVNFSVGSFPKLNPQAISNIVFTYIKPDLKCYISGIGTREIISNISESPLEYNPLNPELKEIRDFKKLVPFEDLNGLLQALKLHHDLE